MKNHFQYKVLGAKELPNKPRKKRARKSMYPFHILKKGEGFTVPHGGEDKLIKARVESNIENYYRVWQPKRKHKFETYVTPSEVVCRRIQ